MVARLAQPGVHPDFIRNNDDMTQSRIINQSPSRSEIEVILPPLGYSKLIRQALVSSHPATPEGLGRNL